MHTFSKNCNAALLSFRSLGRYNDEITQALQKSRWVRHAIDHEGRKRIGSIQRDTPALLNSDRNIQVLCPQSWKEVVPVLLGRDNDSPASSLESSHDKLCEIFQQKSIIRIKHNLVVWSDSGAPNTPPVPYCT